MLSKLYLLPFLLLSLSISLFAQDPVSAVVNSNNVRAVINSNGSLFWDFENGQFIPNFDQQDNTTMRASGLWLAGINPAGNLKGAIQLYNENDKHDFLPGFYNATTQETTLNDIWHVSAEKIETHLADFADNGVVDNPIDEIYAWPATGNPFFFQYNDGMELPNTSVGLAPFWDVNGNGNYNPDQGDYPVINVRGCDDPIFAKDMWWFLFHDNVVHTESQMVPMNMEIHCMVFAFECEEDSPINDHIFTSYKLINRGIETLENTYFGVFNDFDIGNPNDDYFGTDSLRAIVYAYNADEIDEGGFETNAPAMSVDMIRGPLAIVSGNLVQLGIAHAMPFEDSGNLNALDYYRILQGLNPDGSPAPNNGYFYTGDPNDPAEWSEVSEQNPPGDRKVVTATEPFILQPGAINEVILAYGFHHEAGNTPLENVVSIQERTDQIQAFFVNCFNIGVSNCTLITPLEEVQSANIHVFPNPARSEFRVLVEGHQIQSLSLIDVTGRIVIRENWGTPVPEKTVEVNDLAPGVYFLNIQMEDGRFLNKKILIH